MSDQGGTIGNLVVSLSADVARFREDMGKAVQLNQSAANQISKDLSGAMGSIEGMFKGIGTGLATVTAVLAGGALFGSFVSKTKEVAGEVLTLSKSFGITAEEASVLRIAADDAFISVETMTAAGSRLTKQLVSNEEAFHNLGVETRDSNGNFRSTTSIMAEVNTKLLEFKEGTDRNVEGVKIYGKGWAEARATLKLTSEAMTEAKDRAERLHLVFGDAGLKSVKEYKLAMKDLDDVTESFKVSIGTKLLPILTQLAVAFGEAGASAADHFATGLQQGIRNIAESKLAIQDLLNNAKAMAHPTQWLTQSGRDEIRAELAAQEQMYQYSMEKIAGRYGNSVKAKTSSKPGLNSEGSDDTAENDQLVKQQKAAQDAYLSYEKAFSERVASEVKTRNAELEEINKENYEYGLVSLQQYLDRKHSLNEAALEAELKSKQDELDKVRESEARALEAFDKDSTGDAAKNVNDAYAKTEQAIKAVTEAQSKLTIAKLTDAAETKKMTQEQNVMQRQYIESLQESRDKLDGLLGKDADVLKAEKAIRDEEEKMAKLRDELMKANPARAAQIQEQLNEETMITEELRKQLGLTLNLAAMKSEVAALTAEIAIAEMSGDAALAATLKGRVALLGQVKNNTDSLTDAQNAYSDAVFRGDDVAASNAQYRIDAYTEIGKKLEWDITLNNDLTNAARSGLVSIAEGTDNVSNSTDRLAGKLGGVKSGYKAIAEQVNVLNGGLFAAMNFTTLIGQRTSAMAMIGVNEGRAAIGSEALGPVHIDYTSKSMFGGYRANGGSVQPYHDYVVGERGPEVLRVGSEGGSVIPNGAGGGITVNIGSITANSAADGHSIAATIRAEIVKVSTQTLMGARAAA